MRSPLARVVTLVAALAASPSAFAATRSPIPIQRFSLPNGLSVVVQEDHTVPVVAVEVYYHVGSKDEAPGKTGFAHLFEHLMFKGSRNVGDGQHFNAVIEAGGTCNATTNRDRTNYYEVVPSSFLERALFLEADRMAHLLDGLTQRSLDNQRDVVRNERRQNYENRPYGSSVRALTEALYPATHPYHWLTIGDHADLERASLADVQAFFRTYYRPGNATLALVGDVDLPTAKRLVEKQFGAIPSNPADPTQPPSKQRTVRPKPLPIVQLSEASRTTIEDRVSLERLTIAWPTPAELEPGDAELDLLSVILGPSSGRLHRRLVHEAQLAQQVSVGQSSSLLSSHFEITVTLAPGHTSDEVLPIIDAELTALRDGKQPITAAELAQAKTRGESELFFSLQSALGRATRILGYDYSAGDPDFVMKDLRRYQVLTAEKVQAAASRHLGDKRVVLIVKPQTARPASSATPKGDPR